MDERQSLIYNNGERIIPNVTHSDKSLRSHVAVYTFFRILARDYQIDKPFSILDVGCGVGYGTQILSRVPNSHVTGIDVSKDVIDYAKEFYASKNTEYHCMDFLTADLDEYDFVFSSNALEHITDGIDKFSELSYNYAMAAFVPYKESSGAPHHSVHSITEEYFESFESPEFYYTNSGGDIFNQPPHDVVLIGCVSKKIQQKP